MAAWKVDWMAETKGEQMAAYSAGLSAEMSIDWLVDVKVVASAG